MTKLSKYNFSNLEEMMGGLVFLDSDDEFVTLTRVISFKPQSSGLSFVSGSIPVAKFIINKQERKVSLRTSFDTYDRLLKMSIVDDTCENPSLKRAYEDFMSEFTKYTLTGDIDVG